MRPVRAQLAAAVESGHEQMRSREIWGCREAAGRARRDLTRSHTRPPSSKEVVSLAWCQFRPPQRQKSRPTRDKRGRRGPGVMQHAALIRKWFWNTSSAALSCGTAVISARPALGAPCRGCSRARRGRTSCCRARGRRRRRRAGDGARRVSMELCGGTRGRGRRTSRATVAAGAQPAADNQADVCQRAGSCCAACCPFACKELTGRGRGRQRVLSRRSAALQQPRRAPHRAPSAKRRSICCCWRHLSTRNQRSFQAGWAALARRN